MFPNTVILGLDLYWWMFVIGIIVAMVAFRLFHDRTGVSARVFNFIIILMVGAIIVGYVSALLFQSVSEYIETGVFRWGVGAAFYGGLLGAAVVFLAGYFGIGHFVFKDKVHIAEFNNMLSGVLPCVAVAHGFGRLGCLFDGCCYGVLTESPIGMSMYVNGEWETRVPVQLFEALFLFALFLLLVFLRVRKNCEYTASLYMVLYGVWRFFIEFARDDVRGASGIPFLSPSQLTAILLVIFGVAFGFFYKYFLKKKLESVAKSHEKTEAV